MSKRAIAAVLVVGVLAVGGYTFLRSAWAAPAGGCNPEIYDPLQGVMPGDKLTSPMFNKIQCLINALQQKVVAGTIGGGMRRACVPLTNVAPGARVLVPIEISGVNLMGTELVIISVVDTASPARLEYSDTQSQLGTSVKVNVWNRDANVPHSGTVCAGVPS